MTKTRIISAGAAFVLLAIGTLLLWTSVTNARNPLTISNYGPPTRIPQFGTGGADIDPEGAASSSQGFGELQVLSGHGTDQSKQAFAAAINSLPFKPHLITKLPKGFELYHVDANIDGEENSASFGATYIKLLPKGRIDLHTYQNNSPVEPNPSAAAKENWAETKEIEIGSKKWKYILLVHPQPDSTAVKLHYISRVFDSVRVVIDIKGNAPDAELLEILRSVASSLD